MHNIFVYGTLKRGWGNHYLIQDQEYVSNATTVDHSFQMYSLGGFPGVVSGDKQITGELYKVNDLAFKYCDQLEGHPNFYERKKVHVEDADGNIVSAWIYIYKGNTENLEPIDIW